MLLLCFDLKQIKFYTTVKWHCNDCFSASPWVCKWRESCLSCDSVFLSLFLCCVHMNGLNISASFYPTFPMVKLRSIVPIYKKGDKTYCSNYRGISLLPSSYKILSNILLSRLIPNAEEIIGDHHCGFWHNRSTTDHIFCFRQILEKKWEYNEAVHQLFIDFKNAYDSVRREVLYNILIKFGISVKLVRLVKVGLTEMYSRVWVG